MSPSTRQKAKWVFAIVALVSQGNANADPYRLRADVYAEAPETAGFVMVQAEGRAELSPILYSAEALVWAGANAGTHGGIAANGNAVILSVRARDPVHGIDFRFGRLLYQGGAVRPLHFDGGVLTVRSPTGATLEAFAGIPVFDDWRGRSFDWLVGGRTTQAIGDVATFGYSYWQEREEGAIARSELGLEGALTPAKTLAIASTASIDTTHFGLVEARVSAILHDKVNRAELFAVRTSPSRMLPATSLFAALGSYDVDQIGLTGFVRTAPRLDLSASATVDRVADRPGATQWARAELRLDDAGRGSVGLELRRTSIHAGSWTGVRTWITAPISKKLACSTEAELAVPDDAERRGPAWPWGLLSLRYEPIPRLQAAAGIEASSTPQYKGSIGGILRISGIWETKTK